MPTVRELLERAEFRIEELELALGFKETIPLCFNLNYREARMLGLLLKKQIATKEAFTLACAESYRHGEGTEGSMKVYLCHLRAKLRPFRVYITTRYKTGWFLDSEDRKRIQELLEKENL